MRLLTTTLLALALAGTARPDDPPKPAAKGEANRLAGEVSPYLLQHAHNPVDWRPWGPEAFAAAKKESKLVFLSIGYSACHWCHVMERESFSDAAVAKLLNDNFDCVKVDREERPDVDEVYMTALQSLGETGGWPLSMFLTADGKPIFGGTYWPPADRKFADGVAPGFTTVLKRVIELNKSDHAGLVKQSEYVAKLVTDAMAKSAAAKPAEKLDASLVTECANAFEFDPEFGGFGVKLRGFRGTKFPKAPALLFLVRQAAKPGREELAKSVKLTLQRMAEGGIRDQVGGGFHRYSTERTWTVPHFEKMLYDNAQLLEVYALHRQLTGDTVFDDVIRSTATFVEREMTSPDGAFYSALDADSEGKEGAFSVWTTAELDMALGPLPAHADFRDYYSLTGVPNFEEKFFIPRVNLASKVTPTPEFAELRQKLFDVRAKRERPFLDTKILTGWNGQMIAGLAQAGTALKEPKYIAAAEKCADFLLTTMHTPDGRLRRVYAAKPGGKPEARGTAFLDDYAYLMHGLLNLYDATKNQRWLKASKSLADEVLKHFGDPAAGGFYLTPADGEPLFARGKDHYDGAQPSANVTATHALVRLAKLTGDPTYRDAAGRSLKALAVPLAELPTSAPVTADAIDLWLALPKP
jgi:uncharacterized protein YyaL (SSP411 family)